MALKKFIDAAGREAYLDEATNMVYTEGGNNPTYYDLNSWNTRQSKKYGTTGATSSSQSITQMLTDIATKAAKEETKFTKDYLKKNPFAFDENLARESATAEYDPYYSEILKDYLDDVETKRGTVQDEQTLTQKMKEYDMNAKTREYARAVTKTEEGYAGNGLYFSGQKDTTLGQQEVEQQDTMGKLEDTYAAKDTAFEKQYGILDTQAARKERDVTRQQGEAVESGILTRQNEAEKAYYGNLLNTFFRKYPTSSGSGLKGYIPDEYLRY
jgi:hypothetical protein